ncbi:MAG TPA: hypothetical protein VNT55_17700, partial [Baekduia sp.]|nr:hypothetical protein [Baekduia sp.]
GARTLVYVRGVAPPAPHVPQGLVSLLDRRGSDTAGGPALTTALRDGDRRGVQHWLLPDAGGRLVDVERRTADAAFSVRTLLPSGRPGPRHAVTWPSDVAWRVRPTARPVLSGGRVLVATQDGVAPRALIALTRAGRLDRAWGRRGVTRLKDGAAWLLPWRGGVIVVGRRGATWVDRHGRVLGRRALRVDAAATDRAGRLVVARTADDFRHVSVLRLDARHRVDRGFGRLALRAAAGGRSRPLAIAAGDDGRVVVLGERVAYETFSDFREDFTDLVPRGTVIWRLRR